MLTGAAHRKEPSATRQQDSLDTAARVFRQVSKRPVVNEIYHELIFTAPEDLFVRPTPRQ
eukprot:COSAG04_NODE_11216_length_722_cov_1.719101_2_plen_59_part_01